VAEAFRAIGNVKFLIDNIAFRLALLTASFGLSFAVAYAANRWRTRREAKNTNSSAP